VRGSEGASSRSSTAVDGGGSGRVQGAPPLPHAEVVGSPRRPPAPRRSRHVGDQPLTDRALGIVPGPLGSEQQLRHLGREHPRDLPRQPRAADAQHQVGGPPPGELGWDSSSGAWASDGRPGRSAPPRTARRSPASRSPGRGRGSRPPPRRPRCPAWSRRRRPGPARWPAAGRPGPGAPRPPAAGAPRSSASHGARPGRTVQRRGEGGRHPAATVVGERHRRLAEGQVDVDRAPAGARPSPDGSRHGPAVELRHRALADARSSGTPRSTCHRGARPKMPTWSMAWFAPVCRSSGGRSAVSSSSGTSPVSASTTAGCRLATADPLVTTTGAGRPWPGRARARGSRRSARRSPRAGGSGGRRAGPSPAPSTASPGQHRVGDPAAGELVDQHQREGVGGVGGVHGSAPLVEVGAAASARRSSSSPATSGSGRAGRAARPRARPGGPRAGRRRGERLVGDVAGQQRRGARARRRRAARAAPRPARRRRPAPRRSPAPRTPPPGARPRRSPPAPGGPRRAAGP
jgi:hypothetical protein